MKLLYPLLLKLKLICNKLLFVFFCSLPKTTQLIIINYSGWWDIPLIISLIIDWILICLVIYCSVSCIIIVMNVHFAFYVHHYFYIETDPLSESLEFWFFAGLLVFILLLYLLYLLYT